MNRKQKIRIGDLLVQHKLISETQLTAALAEQKKSGRKLGRVLVDLAYIKEDDLLKLLSTQLDIPFIDLKHFKFNPDIVRLLPETHARRYRAIVLGQNERDVLVGMADPTDIFGYDELTRMLSKPVRLALVREADLLRAIDLVYRRTEEISSLAEELGEELSEGDYDLAQLVADEGVVDAPVIKLLQSMFEDAVQVNASDIHIEPDETMLRIRQRIDGVLQEQVLEGKRIASALVTRLKLMSGLDISEKRLPQDGRFSIRVKDRTIDVRVSTMPIQYGESVVLRLLDQSADLLKLEQLGMPPDMLPRFKQAVEMPMGLVLVTGPTGSGKTTSMYAALNHINTPVLKIITVEDPVEYRLPRINQVQVNPRIGLDFARVLRSGLRQDPDVMMVGEVRDAETAEIVLRAAMTGHLVLSTVHTNDAISTISRLLDMGAEGYLIAAALNAVVAQRLVRRVCDSCITNYAPDPRQLAWLRHIMTEQQLTEMHFKHGQGCTYCNGTGYRGRIGVYELLEMDQKLSDALRRSDTSEFTRLALKSSGYRSFVNCALDYAAKGITSLEEVMRIAGDIERYTDLPASLHTLAASGT
jgi:MSHA biogenesis protein MshE